MFAFDHPLVSIFLAAVLGFIFKIIWDRFFSQSSRITRKECDLMRTGCAAIREANKNEFLRMIRDNQDDFERLLEKDEVCNSRRVAARVETVKLLRVILMAQLKICSHLSLDCEDISKALVDMGALD